MADVADLRVLLVDDNEMQHRLVPRVLSRAGITRVHSEARARAVPDAVEAFDPDVILLDMHLPDGDGFDVLAALAENDQRWDHRRVVLVTGDTDPGVTQQALALGAREVLLKPFGIHDLMDLVTRLAASIDQPLPAADQPPPTQVNLVDVIGELASADRLEDIVRIVRTAARRLTGADGATFVLRDEDQCHYVDEDAISPLWKGSKFPMTACISGWAMLHRQAVVIEDVYADDRIPQDVYRPTFVKSLVMVPIRTAEPVGAIGNYWASQHQPTDDEVRVLQALADSTALAMQNARPYAELDDV